MKRKAMFFAVALLCAAGYVFYRGWVSLSVNVGECAVLSSRTGGVYPRPVINGEFLWRWEALIPKNVTLTSYSMAPRTVSSVISGSLPSAELYSMQVKGNPDFTYSFKIDVVLSPKADRILSVAGCAVPLSSEQLEATVTETARLVASDAADFIIRGSKECAGPLAPEYTSEEILSAIAAEEKFAAFNISSVLVREAVVPDTDLYALAKNTYSAYQEALGAALEREAEIQAKALVEDNRTLSKLERFGEVLEKYPNLAAVFKDRDIASVLQTIEAFR